MKFRKFRLFLHYVTFGLYPKPNIVADFFGASVQDIHSVYEIPEYKPVQHPAQRSVSWLDDNFGT